MPKRAPNGNGCITQRKDGSWMVKVTTGRDPGTGKPIYKYTYHKSQKEAREHLRQITATIDKGTYQEPSKMTLGAWLDIWLSEYLDAVKPATAYS